MQVSAQSCFLFLQDQAALLSVIRGREQGALVSFSKAAPLFFPLNFSYWWHMANTQNQAEIAPKSRQPKQAFHQTAALTSAMQYMQMSFKFTYVHIHGSTFSNMHNKFQDLITQGTTAQECFAIMPFPFQLPFIVLS